MGGGGEEIKAIWKLILTMKENWGMAQVVGSESQNKFFLSFFRLGDVFVLPDELKAVQRDENP